jgi:hypothetical protein
MMRRVALETTDVSEELSASFITFITDSCHPDEGGATFFLNVGSYKSHTA